MSHVKLFPNNLGTGCNTVFLLVHLCNFLSCDNSSHSSCSTNFHKKKLCTGCNMFVCQSTFANSVRQQPSGSNSFGASCFGEIPLNIFEKYSSGFLCDEQLPHCRQQRPSGPTSYGSDQVIPLQTSPQSADRSLPPGISQFRRRVATSSICENNPFRTLMAVSNLQPVPHEIILMHKCNEA